MIRKCIVFTPEEENFVRETAFRNHTTQSDVVRNALRLMYSFMDQHDLTYLKDIPTYIRSFAKDEPRKRS